MNILVPYLSRTRKDEIASQINRIRNTTKIEGVFVGLDCPRCILVFRKLHLVAFSEYALIRGFIHKISVFAVC